MKNLTHLTAYHYELPKDLIASFPLEKRDDSRLMVVHRETGEIEEMKFFELSDFLSAGDQLILNNTRVIKARLFGSKSTGAKVEIFLVKSLDNMRWEVMAKPGKKLKDGDQVFFAPDFSCTVEKTLPTGHKVVSFQTGEELSHMIELYGTIPLPHYMEREAKSEDAERYQTVYGTQAGALAAPTAGLHFTPELFHQLESKGVNTEFVTLHVGLGTFKPVQVDDIRQHKMHGEFFTLSEETADKMNRTQQRQICVGTTTCRVLETCSNEKGRVHPGSGETDIFIYPGYTFKCVTSLLTNFHLPESTLLMLVSAFAGYELTMEAYRKAVEKKFRFYSYGDAMLIL